MDHEQRDEAIRARRLNAAIRVRTRGRRRLAAVTVGVAAGGVLGTGVLAYTAHAGDATTAHPASTTGDGSTSSGTGERSRPARTTNQTQAPNQTPAQTQAPTSTDQAPLTTSSGS